MNLFQLGNFNLASGKQSQWKIDCDALTDEDWKALALMAVPLVTPFGSVEGVPAGGLKFAKALEEYKTEGDLLIAEDVITTGGSMERIRAGRKAKGVVVFLRGSNLLWVKPLFILHPQVIKYFNYPMTIAEEQLVSQSLRQSWRDRQKQGQDMREYWQTGGNY